MIIEASAIEKWYFRGKADTNRFFAVNRTDLTLEPGKVTVLTGRSGSGKTTVMNIMSGLLSPDGGKVLADGKDLYAQDDRTLSEFRNMHFGMIPQGADVLPHLTVMENILLPRGICGRRDPKGTDSAGKAQKLLECMGTGQLADVRAGELSGGETRVAEMYMVLMSDVPFCILDEPFAQIAPIHAEKMKELIAEQKEKKEVELS